MINNKKILAIIPARGGSKGIPHKNIIDLCGKPLIAYTIEEAKKSKYIDCVLVSTDSMEIKEKAILYGAEVPFLRPDNLSTDKAKSIDVVLHTIDFLKYADRIFDYVILLQPTSPLREVKDIDKALKIAIEGNHDSLVSLCETDENPVLMRTIKDNKLEEIMKFSGENMRRQELPKFYKFNGAIYVNSVHMLNDEKVFINTNTIPYIMSKESSVDVDEKIDLKLVEFLLKEKEYV